MATLILRVVFIMWRYELSADPSKVVEFLLAIMQSQESPGKKQEPLKYLSRLPEVV